MTLLFSGARYMRLKYGNLGFIDIQLNEIQFNFKSKLILKQTKRKYTKTEILLNILKFDIGVCQRGK